jgi:hypothetical protein
MLVVGIVGVAIDLLVIKRRACTALVLHCGRALGLSGPSVWQQQMAA